MNNGTRNWPAMTAFQDPGSKLFSLYEPCTGKPGVTLTAVLDGSGKPLRVDAEFIRKHGVPERTGT